MNESTKDMLTSYVESAAKLFPWLLSTLVVLTTLTPGLLILATA